MCGPGRGIAGRLAAHNRTGVASDRLESKEHLVVTGDRPAAGDVLAAFDEHLRRVRACFERGVLLERDEVTAA
jgi:hypothetical protein